MEKLCWKLSTDATLGFSTLVYELKSKKGQPGACSSHMCKVRERVRPLWNIVDSPIWLNIGFA
jgi:hypothetical protein